MEKGVLCDRISLCDRRKEQKADDKININEFWLSSIYPT